MHLFLFLAAFAGADELVKIDVDRATVSGSGCERVIGNEGFKYDSKTGEAVVMFKRFVLESSSTKLNRKACLFAVSYKLPDKKRIEISNASIAVDRVDKAATGTVRLELFAPGSPESLVLEQDLQKISTSNPAESAKFASTDKKFSSCGNAGIIRGNTSALLNKGKFGKVGVTEVKFRVKLSDCGN